METTKIKDKKQKEVDRAREEGNENLLKAIDVFNKEAAKQFNKDMDNGTIRWLCRFIKRGS